MSTKAKVGIAFCTIAGILCLAIIFWYAYIVFITPTKITNLSFSIDKQSVKYEDDGKTESYDKYFWEVNIYDNFCEIIVNSIYDEAEDSFKSYCFQFISNKNELTLDRNYSVIKNEYISTERNPQPGRGLLLWKEIVTRYYDAWLGGNEYKDATMYAYVGNSVKDQMYWQGISNDEALKTINSDKFKFLVQIKDGEESGLYGVAPYGTSRKTHSAGYSYRQAYSSEFREFDGDSALGVGDTGAIYTNKFYSIDFLFVLEQVFEYCKGFNSGTDTIKPLHFDDYFQYFYNTGNNTYSPLNEGDRVLGKVKEFVQSRFTSHIKKSSGKCTNANQSLIGWLNGVENFGVTAENTFEYSTSSGIKKVTENDFQLKVIEDKFTLVLRDEFVEYFTKYIGKIRLKIEFVMSKFLGYETLELNTGDFYVYTFNGKELNQKLSGYQIGGGV